VNALQLATSGTSLPMSGVRLAGLTLVLTMGCMTLRSSLMR
jgi:hypothetical protein